MPPSTDPPPEDESCAACLARAHSLLNQALACASSEQWDAVAALDAECRAAVESLSQRLDATERAALLPSLQLLHHRHRHLLELAEAEREQIVQQHRQSVHARKSVKIYQS